MSTHRILLIQGHPDAQQTHLGHALASAYEQGGLAAGHAMRRISVAQLEFPLLRSQQDWEHGTVPLSLVESQAALLWADHVVLFFPLWLGDMPAMLKAFLEQVARPGFAFRRGGENPFAHKGLSGRSARVVVTMGMPALVYRWYFRAHALKSLERNILGFVGFAPVHATLVGLVGKLDAEAVGAWCRRMRDLGAKAA